jgi:mRNA-degrading endonuclease toxin of MazEF toxin-antitoxin module
MSVTFFARGIVFKVEFPADDPAKKDKNIPKYALNLQEGKIVDKRDYFVCVLLTTNIDKLRVTDVLLTQEEAGLEDTDDRAKVCCESIYTLPKSIIAEPAYTLSESTMREVDKKLLISLCVDGIVLEDGEE